MPTNSEKAKLRTVKWGLTGKCTRCGKDNPEESIYCTVCKLYGRLYAVDYRKQFRIDNNISSSASHHRLAYSALIEHYGSKCACCGETGLKFLTIDHIHNDAAKLLRRSGASAEYKRIWSIAKKTGIWPINLQILCFNCNCGKQRNGGTCPHKDIL